MEGLTAIDPNNEEWQRWLSVADNKIGGLLAVAGQEEKALEEYRKGLAIREKFAASGQREWQRDVAVSYNKIGDILRAGARRADEGNLEWQRDLSVAHTRIGSVLLRQGTRDEALVEYRAGLLIDEKLASAQPDDPQAQIDLAVSLFSLADSGDQPRANLARCLEIMRQLKGQGKLSGSQAGWIPTIEQRLAALPAGE